MSSQSNCPANQPVLAALNTSSYSARDEQLNDLINSIGNKLSMLACDESVDYLEASKLNSPKREAIVKTDEKTNKIRLNLGDLQTSVKKASSQGGDELGESRILGRINQMESFYMEKLQDMASKLSDAEFELEEALKVNRQLKEDNNHLRQQIKTLEKNQAQIINKKIDSMREQLISKFTSEAEMHFQSHMQEMKHINEQLLDERGKRKYLEQQLELVRNQKNNIESFYRNLLQNHKSMIQMDINRIEHQEKMSITKQGTRRVEDNSSSSAKKKANKKPGQLKKSEEMSKQEMIPYLAKGIQELKEKLNIK